MDKSDARREYAGVTYSSLMNTTIIGGRTILFREVFVNSNLMNLETLDELGQVVFLTPSGYAYHLWTECGYLKCAKKICGGTANLLPSDRSLCKGCALEFNLHPPAQALSAGPRPFTTFYNTQARWAALTMRIYANAWVACRDNNLLSFRCDSTLIRLPVISASPGSPTGARDVSRRTEEPASPAIPFEAARGANDCDWVYCPARLGDLVYPTARLDDHRPITPGRGLDGSHDSDSLFDMVDCSAQGSSILRRCL